MEFCRNSNSSKHLWLSLLPARMKIRSKKKALECLQDFPKFMGLFSVAQGQLTTQSVVESGYNSNSIEILWLSSLSARMEKSQPKMKALKC